MDTTTRVRHAAGESNPFTYIPQALVEQLGEEEKRMVGEYDPSWELLDVLWKAGQRTSTYRIGVIPPETETD